MEDIGLLVLGHGSTLPYNKALVEELAGMIKRRHPGPVRTAYLNANDPKIPEGLMSFAGTNVKRIVAIPLFLAAGVHTLEDIPRELGIPKGERVGVVKIDGRDVEVTCAEPLGVDECIADLAYRRARKSF